MSNIIRNELSYRIICYFLFGNILCKYPSWKGFFEIRFEKRVSIIVFREPIINVLENLFWKVDYHTEIIYYSMNNGFAHESILPPFVIILYCSQNPALKRITANACIFWSNTVSANNPSMAPPNAIRTGGAND